jgi:single-strand DNA-binding protein
MSKTNRVTLIGRVGKDPEVRKASTGLSILSMSFVTADSVKNKDGKYENVSEWHNLTAFGKTADSMAQYCPKGTCLIVDGHLKTDSWDDKNGGGKKYKTSIIVESWQFQQGSRNASAPAASEEPAPAEQAGAFNGNTDDDLPY